jgi:excisionase family DNA binding protein
MEQPELEQPELEPPESSLLLETSLLSVIEVARRLECSRPHVYRLISTGELEAIDIATPGSRGSKTRIRESALVEYIERATVK